jgi:signal peptidase I
VFAAGKLKKQRKEARKWLARARRDFERSPNLFPPAVREPLERRLEAFERNLETSDLAQMEHDLRECKRAVDRHLPFHRTSTVREYLEVIVVALALALVIRTFIVQAFKIPSGSMIPTLLVGDHILVNKFIYGVPIPFTGYKIPIANPHRGDIVVFKFPEDPSKDYIKRVIGLPGDTVEVRGTDLIVNGVLFAKKADGTYRFEDPKGYDHTAELYRESIEGRDHVVLYEKTPMGRAEMVRRVPEGDYFCMGDNRDHSNDSRYWGFVPESFVRGKAMVIYFSWPPGQWLRIGRLLH